MLSNSLPQSYTLPQPLSFVREMMEADLPEVLKLLAEDPVRGLHLRGMIEDSGLCSTAHRGRFYGYYREGRLQGLALLGHYILCYGDDDAYLAFAEMATTSQAKGALIFGPKPEVESIWQHLEQQGRETKEVHAQFWLVCENPRLPLGELQLRRANLEEVEPVSAAQAEIIRQECGYDPRNNGRAGFLQRVAERIRRGRTWVKMADELVVFKAELISVTPEAVYLEGIWTHPDYRGQGLAKACMSELVHRLLRHHKFICLTVEEENVVARRVYERVGFIHANSYQVRYLQPLT